MEYNVYHKPDRCIPQETLMQLRSVCHSFVYGVGEIRLCDNLTDPYVYSRHRTGDLPDFRAAGWKETVIRGLHPADGYKMFVRPTLEEALRLVAEFVGPDLEELWITTKVISDHPAVGYDRARDCHRANTYVYYKGNVQCAPCSTCDSEHPVRNMYLDEGRRYCTNCPSPDIG